MQNVQQQQQPAKRRGRPRTVGVDTSAAATPTEAPA
jgi:hypothetical protein